MKLSKLANLSANACCVILTLIVGAICALIIAGPQPRAQADVQPAENTVFVVINDEPLHMTWHVDPYVRIHWNMLPVQPMTEVVPLPVYLVVAQYDSSDPANLVIDFQLRKTAVADLPPHLPYNHSVEAHVWESTEALLRTRAEGLNALGNLAQETIDNYQSMHTDWSSFYYDSVTVKVRGVVVEVIKADFPKPIVKLPRDCRVNAYGTRYLVLVDNNGASIERTDSLFGHGPVRGTASSDFQICATRGWYGDAKWLMRQMAKSYVAETGGTVQFDWRRTEYTLGSVRFIPPAR